MGSHGGVDSWNINSTRLVHCVHKRIEYVSTVVSELTQFLQRTQWQCSSFDSNQEGIQLNVVHEDVKVSSD